MENLNSRKKPHHHINVTKDMKEDLCIWLRFLNEPSVYCRPFIDYSNVLCARDIEWYTDASGRIGFGGIRNGTDFFFGEWPVQFLEKKPSIEFLELYAVTVSVVLWLKLYANQRIYLFIDNTSV